MKQIKYLFILIVSIMIIASCSDMDDYLKYTGGKEIVYTGKVDSLIMRSGRERVVVDGLLIADPNIVKVNVYWDVEGKKDSVIFSDQADPSAPNYLKRKAVGIDTLFYSIPLPEDTYNFKVFTYDRQGRSSVEVNIVGQSLGEKYQKSLYDRPIKSIMQKAGYMEIEWYNSDLTSFVELTWFDSDDAENRTMVYAEDKVTRLLNAKENEPIKMQTFHYPASYAIDIFSVPPRYIKADSDWTELYIKNSGNDEVGFWGTTLGSASGANYGSLIDWTVTDPVKISGIYAGWSDRDKFGVLYFESKAGTPIKNGQIYQTVTLPAGAYKLHYVCNAVAPATSDATRVTAYFVASRGTVLPDIDVLQDNTLISADENILGYIRGAGGSNFKNNTLPIQFTLDEETEITFGFVANLDGSSRIHIQNVKLISAAVL
jgi:hypothetical protein